MEKRVHPTATAAHRAVRELDRPAACVLAAVVRQGQILLPRGNTVALRRQVTVTF